MTRFLLHFCSRQWPSSLCGDGPFIGGGWAPISITGNPEKILDVKVPSPELWPVSYCWFLGLPRFLSGDCVRRQRWDLPFLWRWSWDFGPWQLRICIPTTSSLATYGVVTFFAVMVAQIFGGGNASSWSLLTTLASRRPASTWKIPSLDLSVIVKYILNSYIHACKIQVGTHTNAITISMRASFQLGVRNQIITSRNEVTEPKTLKKAYKNWCEFKIKEWSRERITLFHFIYT